MVNCSSFCLLNSMLVYTSAILAELLLQKFTIFFFYNYYLQTFAECRMTMYKHSTYFSGESFQVWFILFSCESYLVHVIAFGFTVSCLETEIQNAKFHPKAQVLIKVENIWVAWNICVSGGVLLWKKLYDLKAIIFFTLKISR